MQGSTSRQVALEKLKSNPDNVELSYLPREFVLANLPHKDSEAREWVRENGKFTLRMRRSDGENSPRLPFGCIPRLVVAWLTTEAGKRDDRLIKIPGTMSAFLRALRLDKKTGWGVRGDCKRLKEQLTRLFAVRIDFEWSDEFAAADGKDSMDMQIAPGAVIWFESERQGQECWIELSEQFHAVITRSRVPFDQRAMQVLKRNRLATDVYMMITKRIQALQLDGKSGADIPLTSLEEQFGSSYARHRNFRAALREAIDMIKVVYPAIGAEVMRWALRIKATKLPVPAMSKDKAAVAAAGVSKDRLGPRIRVWFNDTFPGANYGQVEAKFKGWLQAREIVPHDIGALFKSQAGKILSG